MTSTHWITVQPSMFEKFEMQVELIDKDNPVEGEDKYDIRITDFLEVTLKPEIQEWLELQKMPYEYRTNTAEGTMTVNIVEIGFKDAADAIRFKLFWADKAIS